MADTADRAATGWRHGHSEAAARRSLLAATYGLHMDYGGAPDRRLANRFMEPVAADARAFAYPP